MTNTMCGNYTSNLRKALVANMKHTSSRVNVVVCNMTDDILSTKIWEPGERLPNELMLAKRYNVSRNTMREAIKVLNADHILVTKPHSGTYVAKNPGSYDDIFGFSKIEEKYQLMIDLYELRMLVEGAAAQMVVQRATDEEIEEILFHERLCKTLIQEKKSWSEADKSFHTAIAKASHNMAFSRIIPSIHQSEYLGYSTISSLKNEKNTLHYHALIAESIKRRDEVGAILASRYHMQQAIEDLKEQRD